MILVLACCFEGAGAVLSMMLLELLIVMMVMAVIIMVDGAHARNKQY